MNTAASALVYLENLAFVCVSFGLHADSRRPSLPAELRACACPTLARAPRRRGTCTADRITRRGSLHTPTMYEKQRSGCGSLLGVVVPTALTREVPSISSLVYDRRYRFIDTAQRAHTPAVRPSSRVRGGRWTLSAAPGGRAVSDLLRLVSGEGRLVAYQGDRVVSGRRLRESHCRRRRRHRRRRCLLALILGARQHTPLLGLALVDLVRRRRASQGAR